MDQFDFYPDPKSLKRSVTFGVAYLALSALDWRILSASGSVISPGGLFTLGLFSLVGVFALYRGVSGLIHPKPCFVADAEGFSVMGKAKRRWDDLVDVRIRRIRIFGDISAGTWVSLRVRKNGRGLTRRAEIPWSHLPAGPDETAAAILQAALLAGWQPADARTDRRPTALSSRAA